MPRRCEKGKLKASLTPSEKPGTIAVVPQRAPGACGGPASSSRPAPAVAPAPLQALGDGTVPTCSRQPQATGAEGRSQQRQRCKIQGSLNHWPCTGLAATLLSRSAALQGAAFTGMCKAPGDHYLIFSPHHSHTDTHIRWPLAIYPFPSSI